jgi:hypothetical protein
MLPSKLRFSKYMWLMFYLFLKYLSLFLFKILLKTPPQLSCTRSGTRTTISVTMTQIVLLHAMITELSYFCNMRFEIMCRVASVERSLSMSVFYFVAKVVCDEYKLIIIL